MSQEPSNSREGPEGHESQENSSSKSSSPESPGSSPPSSWNSDNSSPSQEFPPKLEKGKRYLYIIREQEDSYRYKIGITDDDPEIEKLVLQEGNSRPLILKKTFKGKDEDVKKMKNDLHEKIIQRKIGEKMRKESDWFKVQVYNVEKLKDVVKEIVPNSYEKPEEGKWLYIMREQEDFYKYKIGVSENPEERIKNLKTGNGRCLIFKRFFEGLSQDATNVETELLIEIEPRRIGKRMRGGGTEWFQIPLDNIKPLYFFVFLKASKKNLKEVKNKVIYPKI